MRNVLSVIWYQSMVERLLNVPPPIYSFFFYASMLNACIFDYHSLFIPIVILVHSLIGNKIRDKSN